jgi:hypothetical protein
MGSGGEDEPVDVIFLHVLHPPLLLEEVGGDLGLADGDEVGLAQQAGAE